MAFEVDFMDGDGRGKWGGVAVIVGWGYSK